MFTNSSEVFFKCLVNLLEFTLDSPCTVRVMVASGQPSDVSSYWLESKFPGCYQAND